MSAERSIVADLPAVEIWTDGSCNNRTRAGGYAAVLRFGTREKSLEAPLHDTTSQRCELHAAIESLKTLKKRCSVTIHTDSTYLMEGATEWAPTWLAKGQLHIKANCDLWSELLCLMQEHDVYFEKVLAHTGVEMNERVDQMARSQTRVAQREANLASEATDAFGVVVALDEAREARRTQREASREVQWPVESTDNYLRFGREVTLLYPFVQHGKEEVPKVMTPLGPGTLKQAFSDGVKVALDNPVRWLYSKSGKPSPAMEEFQIREVWPLTDMENELEDESSDGPRLHGVWRDRTHQPERRGRGDEDKAMLPERSNGGGRGVGAEEGKVDTEPEASESNAELSLFQ